MTDQGTITTDAITALPNGRIKHVRGTWSAEYSVAALPSKVALYERLAVMCETREKRPDPKAAEAYRATAKALRDVLQMVRRRAGGDA
ncbi:MAG: hypothetical protein AAGI03_09150 [Pseudomonadota bacterium]